MAESTESEKTVLSDLETLRSKCRRQEDNHKYLRSCQLAERRNARLQKEVEMLQAALRLRRNS